MLTRHQQLIEVHVRRKGQFAAVPFSAHQGLKVSRYHIGAAPYVFAKKKAAPSVTSDFFETRGSHQSRGLTDGGLQRVRNFVSLFGSWDLLKFRWLNFSLLSCDDYYLYSILKIITSVHCNYVIII